MKQNEHGISWTDRTWNFIRGCSRVSDGCQNCYAEAMARRFSGKGQPYEGTISERGKWNGNITFHENKLLEALKWKNPQRVFVNSMSDLFHENVKDYWIEKAFAMMAVTPHITYQILTKRPERMRAYFSQMQNPEISDYLEGSPFAPAVSRVMWQLLRIASDGQIKSLIDTGHLVEMDEGVVWFARWPLPSVWLGVSVEDQKTADERIPHLLKTPAAMRLLSVEPLLEPINLKPYLYKRGDYAFCNMCGADGHIEDMPVANIDGEGDEYICPTCGGGEYLSNDRAFGRVDLVIVGVESGPKRRFAKLEWIESIVEQCKTAAVPVFVKQIELNGKVEKDIEKFPPHLQLREFPK